MRQLADCLSTSGDSSRDATPRPRQRPHRHWQKVHVMPHKNKEDRRRWAAEWRARNREKINARGRLRSALTRKAEWQKLKADPVRMAVRKHKTREAYVRLRTAALQMYGNACACCRETMYEFLSFDHIDGTGADHRRQLGKNDRQRVFLKWLLAEKRDNIRVLCHNCNAARGFYGRCPHES